MQKEFEQVIANNLGRIRYIASRYCQHNDFDDIYQEILMQLWRSFSSFKGNSSRETWLYKVALNTACTFVSKSIKHRELQQSLSELIKPMSQPGEENCQAEILNTFMNSLSDIDASILMMYLDGMTSEDMAAVVGITSNAVRVRVKRIKSTFENKYIGEES
jgi:RNA polymerase sigma-70 factor (ECF subfamily)